MTPTATLRLLAAWEQCQRHARHLNHALAGLRDSLPLSAEAVAHLSDEAVQRWDQFVWRFTRLQDAMGARLFPAVLAHLQEPLEDQPMLDKLHRLEKLGYLRSTEEWQRWRAIRNRFAHDHPEDDALRAASLNQAVEAVPALLETLDRVAPLVRAAQA